MREVARWHEISTALIYTWRKARVKMHEPPFVEAVVTPDPVVHATSPVIVIEFTRGGRISLGGKHPQEPLRVKPIGFCSFRASINENTRRFNVT